MGISPYTQVGYKINSVEFVEGNIDRYLVELSGSGGLSRFYWDNSLRLLKNLSVGVSTSYLFGNIETSEFNLYPKIGTELTYVKTANYNRLFADFGFQYRQSVNDKIIVSLGGIFGSAHRINYDQQVSLIDDGGNLIENELTGTGYFTLPYYYGGGLAVSYNRKLTLTGDYIYENWSDTKSDDNFFNYVGASKLRFGAEFVPGGDLISDYFKMIRYRIGFYSDQSYVQIEGHRIKDTGFTLGLSFPFLRNKSTINLALMAGQYGTLENSLIRERYGSVYVSFELHDWWFLKSQYE